MRFNLNACWPYTLNIVNQLFLKVLKSGHHLTFAGKALNKVVIRSPGKYPKEIFITGA